MAVKMTNARGEIKYPIKVYSSLQKIKAEFLLQLLAMAIPDLLSLLIAEHQHS